MKSVAQRRSISFSLADVATKLLAHPDESTVDVAGSLSHPSRSRQCNKRDNQQVLDQSLATLVVVKSLQPSQVRIQFVTPVIQKLNGFIGISGRFMLHGSAGQ